MTDRIEVREFHAIEVQGGPRGTTLHSELTDTATSGHPASAITGLAAAVVSDAAYDATAWDGVTSIAPSKNAVRDKLVGLETLARDSTTRWIDSWVSSAFAQPDMVHQPVVTWAATMTTALSSPVVYKPEKCGIGSATVDWNGASDPVFRYFSGLFETKNGGAGDLGLCGQTKPLGFSQAARWPLVFEFVTSSANSTVEIAFYSLSPGMNYLVEINGKFLSDSPLTTTATTNGHRMTLTFPTAASRRIRIWNTGECGLAEVRVPTGQSITKPTSTITRRVALIGDSYINGAGTAVGEVPGTLSINTFAPRLARLMGADDIIMAGIGSTGFVNGSDGGTPNPYSTRLSAVLAMNPHVLIVNASINDGSAGTGVQAAVTNFLSTAAAVPEIYVMGVMQAGHSSNSAAAKTAALAAGRKYIDTDAFMYGTGSVSNQTGVGNRDYFMGPDNTHGTIDFHKAVADSAFRLVKLATP